MDEPSGRDTWGRDATVFRSLVARSVAFVVLLPIALVVILGLGALLLGMGDGAGARFCGRILLAGGVAWVVSIVAMALATAALALDASRSRCRSAGGGRRRRRRRTAGDSRGGRSGDSARRDGDG